MTTWPRRIRGAVGMGITWGLGWLGAGLVLLAVVGLDAADVPFPLFFGALGFLGGVTFSGLLAVVERRRRFDQMSIPRFAGWGAVGGLVFSVLFLVVLALAGEPALQFAMLSVVFALAGAGSAAGSLVLARSGEDRDALDAGGEGSGEGFLEDGG